MTQPVFYKASSESGKTSSMAIAIVQWEKMRPNHGIGSVGGGSFRDRANGTG